MKKRKSLLKATGKMFLFAFATAMTIYSCKKIEEKPYTGASANKTPGITKSEGSSWDALTDEQVHQKIQQLAAVLNENLTDQWDEVKPTNASQSMDYLEGVLNYSYGNAGAQFVEMETFSQNFIIPVGTDGNYYLDDYTGAFNTMSAYIVNVYNSVTHPNKSIFAINLELGDIPTEVTMDVRVVHGPIPPSYQLKSYFGIPLKYDRVSGECANTIGGDAACVVLEDLGNHNMFWYRTMGGTMLRQAGYYVTVSKTIVDITKAPLLSSTPVFFTSHQLNFPIFAYDSWLSKVGMPCITSDQLNFYLDHIKPLFDNLVSAFPNRDFTGLTVNPKYNPSGSFSNPGWWGDPQAPGFNITSKAITLPSQNAAMRGTFYEHYYIFESGRYINYPQPGHL